MAEEKDKEEVLPEVKELEDGSVEITTDAPEGEEEVKEAKPEAKEADESDDSKEDKADEPKQEDEDEITEEEREKIREARREERRLKKELQKQREVTAKNKISSLEKQNNELAKRLAQLESTATSFQISQADKYIEDASTRVEYAKLKMLEAARANDAESQIQWMEQFSEAKTQLQQANHYKSAQIEAVKRPKQNVPTPVSKDVAKFAGNWMKKNAWYDPSAKDTDSRIAKVIDNELANEGWDPSDSDYWEELDNRLQERLPHRYNKPGVVKQEKASGPTAGTRATPQAAKANTITLSRERVQAIKDAGAWDDPARRAKMIKAYTSYDKLNKKG